MEIKSAEELQALDLDGAQLRDLVIQWWFKDNVAGDFLSKERAGAISLSMTSNPDVEYQPTRRVWSDSILHQIDSVSRQLRGRLEGRGQSDTAVLDDNAWTRGGG